MARSQPGFESIRRSLGDKYAGSFQTVMAQSPVPSIQTAAELLRETSADGVVALGGGSAIVTARAASIVAAESADIESLATIFEKGKPPHSPRLAQPKAKQFIIPTTPTTAYAKAGAAAAAPGEGRRLSLFDPKARAHAIFFDPAFFMPTPSDLFREAALDAFALGIQGLESNNRNALADAPLLHGVRLIRRNLPLCDYDQNGIEARGAIMLAALMIGEATDHTGSGLASALGHMIGARYNVANGLVKAIVLPHTLQFNEAITAGRLAETAEAMGVSPTPLSDVEKVADACSTLFRSLGLPARLRDLDIPKNELGLIAQEAEDDFFYFQNPRPVARADLIEMLEKTW
jgi:alcohol dehydrogenase class IV